MGTGSDRLFRYAGTVGFKRHTLRMRLGLGLGVGLPTCAGRPVERLGRHRLAPCMDKGIEPSQPGRPA